MLLHVLRHVDADERVLVVEQELGQRLGELGLADAGRPEEHERADRPVGILKTGPGPPAPRWRPPCTASVWPTTRLRERLFHLQELLAFAFEHPVDRNAGPARHDLRHVLLRHRLLDHRAPRLRPPRSP